MGAEQDTNGAGDPHSDPYEAAAPRPTYVPPALTRRLGFPPHAAVAPIAIGAFACSLALDVSGYLTDAPCSDYTYPAFLLLVTGVAAGLVTVTIALPDLVRLPHSPERSSAVRQLILWDLLLVCFGVSAILRHDADTCADATPTAFVLSCAGSVLTVAAVVLGLRQAYSQFRVTPRESDDDPVTSRGAEAPPE